ncbi:MAG: hypothetical protein M1514_00175 [Patescibacteria group bacterium]|nr:hypothetical protein [Patescibacteria group bacterium]
MLNFFKIKLTSLLKDRSWVLEILPILLLGLLSFTWFRGNNFIGGGDFGMPMDWIKCLKSLTWSWNEDYSFGAHDPRSLTILIPYVLIGAFLQGLGISLVLIEKIIFYLLFVSGGLSMYYLCSALGIKKIGKIVASLFFMVNPFSLIIIWRVSHAFIQMPYAFAPLYLGLYINGLLKKKNYVYWLLVTLIWEFTSTSSYTWQAAVIIHWLPIGLYFIFFFFAFPKQRNYAIKSTLMLVFSWLLINAYWLLPFITSLSQAIASAHSPALMSDIDTLKLTSVKIFEAIRMMGFWSLHSGYRGEPYYPYHNYYNNFFVLSISWLIPVLVIFGLWKNWICKNKLIFFYSIALITFGLLGMSGPTLPFGNLIIGLYKLFPPLALLTRFTFLFFGIPAFLAFTYLIGEGVNFLWEKGEKKFSSFLYFPLGLLGFLLFVILVWPFWNGEVIRSGNNNYPGERFTVPSYWFDAKKWLAEEKVCKDQ